MSIVRRLIIPLVLGSTVLESASYAQTGCGVEHTQPGVFVCYPSPPDHPEDAHLAPIFHLSAQGNAPAGRAIRRYVVFLDGHRVYETRLATPLRRISIETNITSPFSSGEHTLALFVDGAGTVQITGLTFQVSANFIFCDPFNRVEAGSCVVSRMKRALNWSLAQAADSTPSLTSPDEIGNPLKGYADYLGLYSQNLKSLEADGADAVAVDAQGNLYIASHSYADIDLRKYSSNGSLIYDTVVRARQEGFLQIEGMAIDHAGHVWIAGNTTALFATTPKALAVARADKPPRSQGFVMLVDTSTSGSGPTYFTYLSPVDNCIRDLRVDEAGNAYVTGTTASTDFAHETLLRVSERSQSSQQRNFGFVSALNASGSALIWSTLISDADLSGLAVDDTGIVYVMGRSTRQGHGVLSEDMLVASLSESGHRLSYLAHFDRSGAQQGYAISARPHARWIFLAGFTTSQDNSSSSVKEATDREPVNTFVTAFQPCRTGMAYSQVLTTPDVTNSPEIAYRPALEAFVRAWPPSTEASVKRNRSKSRAVAVNIQVAHECSSGQ